MSADARRFTDLFKFVLFGFWPEGRGWRRWAGRASVIGSPLTGHGRSEARHRRCDAPREITSSFTLVALANATRGKSSGSRAAPTRPRPAGAARGRALLRCSHGSASLLLLTAQCP